MDSIKEIIEKLDISQSDFCKKYKIPKRTLAHWLAGERKPPEYVISLLKDNVEKTKSIREKPDGSC
ncbi:helix-turn-helix domain-containing protein [Candidatus Saccharibacteria bacterium]|nr:helix-turn-helix domain-containing protein [Candidatus Saccharibacteria bacterium]